MLVGLKDLLLVMSQAILSDPVASMMSGGLLYAGNAILTMIALPYTDNSSNVIDVILSFSISLHMLMTTSLGFADALGADDNERTNSKITARAPWLLGAFVLGSAAAMLLMLQRIFIAVPGIKALLPSAILPISFEDQARMIRILLQECSAQRFKAIVESMYNSN